VADPFDWIRAYDCIDANNLLLLFWTVLVLCEEMVLFSFHARNSSHSQLLVCISYVLLAAFYLQMMKILHIGSSV